MKLMLGMRLPHGESPDLKKIIISFQSTRLLIVPYDNEKMKDTLLVNENYLSANCCL